MRKLKMEYKKIKVKKPKIILPKILPRIQIKPKVGRWCRYYEGRIPFPIECGYNSQKPSCLERPYCRSCKRKVTFSSWKNGEWNKISEAVKRGEDLSDWNEMPGKKEEDYDD